MAERNRLWLLVLSALVIFIPFIASPLYSVDSAPFPIEFPLLAEGRWGVYVLFRLLFANPSGAIYYSLGVVLMVASAWWLVEKVFADVSGAHLAVGLLIVANPALILMTPWPLQFFGNCVGFALATGALWAVTTQPLRWAMPVSIVALTFAFAIYQQNAIVACVLWLVWAITKLPDRKAIARSAVAWAICLAVATAAYFVVMHLVFADALSIGAWRNGSSSFAQRLDPHIVANVLGKWFPYVAILWGVMLIAAGRRAGIAVLALVVAYVATYAFSIAFGVATYERMMAPLYLAALAVPALLVAPRWRAVSLGAASLIVLLVALRAGEWHAIYSRGNDNGIALVREVASRIDNPNHLPVVLVGNRAACEYPDGTIYVFCNYWRAGMFRNLLNQNYRSWSEVGRPEDAEFAAALPAYPAAGFAQERNGVIYARIGPELTWGPTVPAK